MQTQDRLAIPEGVYTLNAGDFGRQYVSHFRRIVGRGSDPVSLDKLGELPDSFGFLPVVRGPAVESVACELAAKLPLYSFLQAL